MIALFYYFLVEEHPVKALDYRPQYSILADSSYYCNIVDAELPYFSDSSSYIISHIGRYSYYYMPEYGISSWVAYRLTRKDLIGEKVKRTYGFRRDKVVISRKWKAPSSSDYYRSFYNKGHLIPSSDRQLSKAENRETFIYSNATPQHPRFNSGVWLMIETKVKEWAFKYNELFVITGTIVDEDYGYIGGNKIAIPLFYYKCVAFRVNDEWYGAGFLVPNSEKLSNKYKKYLYSINEIEEIVGFDIFPHIEEVSGGKYERKLVKKLFI